MTTERATARDPQASRTTAAEGRAWIRKHGARSERVMSTHPRTHTADELREELERDEREAAL